jgi:signal transduction histidine kinase
MVQLPLRTGGMPEAVASLGLSASPTTLPKKDQPDASARPLRPAHARASQDMFRIIRYFSIASFVCIVAAAVALTAYFRHITIRELVEFGESGNVALTEAALQAVRAELIQFLDEAGKAPAAELARLPLAPALAHEIDDLMRVKSVARLKIYGRDGLVVYATRKASVGRRQPENPGFQAAMAGNVASKLVYRDSFNLFDAESEADNLIQTYVPIRSEPDEAPRGVFELYTDVNPMIEEVERAQWQIIGGAVLIMSLLYLALLGVVHHAERIIGLQQRKIREHAAALERISARLLSSQEEEKRKIAFDLHEGVAQTLSAVKMSVEYAAQQLAVQGRGNADALQPMVQAVKDAINEVRSVALNLRPSSLDELGLVATVEWFCREFSRLHPEIAAQHTIELGEADVPPPLKIIIYRVLEEACRDLSQLGNSKQVRVRLASDEASIWLDIEQQPAAGAPAANAGEPVLAAARERTLLSGGSFDVRPNARGGLTLRAAWLR